MFHRRFVAGVVCFALLAACGRSEPTATPTAAVVAANADATTAPMAPPADDCTFETPLVPGVPGSPGHLIPSTRNPNGQSELAALMREMQDHMVATRAAIVEGRPVGPVPASHRRMRCAWPTTPADRDAKFDAFAINYLAQLEALHDTSRSTPLAERYGSVLKACRTCHENACPGPIMAIDSLALDRYKAQ